MKKALIFWACLFFTGQIYAQTSQLDGIWVLENASVVQITGKDSITMDPAIFKKDPFFALFDKLNFRADTLNVINRAYDFELEGVYIPHNDMIEIPFTGAPLSLEYVITDEKLYLKQRLYPQDTPLNNTYLVSTIYIKEKNATGSTK